MADKMTKAQLDKWLKERYDREFLDKLLDEQFDKVLQKLAK